MTQAFLDKYGNPDEDGDGVLDRGWFNENIEVFTLPFPLVLSWAPATTVRRFQAHRLAGDRIVAALSRAAAFGGVEELKARKLDRWGGCFNFRLMRGGSTLSAHAWGTAVDFNPDVGRLGSWADARTYPRFIIDAFEAEGFAWGGRWARPDAMHFELQT